VCDIKPVYREYWRKEHIKDIFFILIFETLQRFGVASLACPLFEMMKHLAHMDGEDNWQLPISPFFYLKKSTKHPSFEFMDSKEGKRGFCGPSLSNQVPSEAAEHVKLNQSGNHPSPKNYHVSKFWYVFRIFGFTFSRLTRLYRRSRLYDVTFTALR